MDRSLDTTRPISLIGPMGKYDALGAFLRRWKTRNDADGVEISYAQIEGIIRGVLPRAVVDVDWWSAAEPSGVHPPHRRAWLNAGFEAIADPARECVYFRKRSQD